MKNSKPVAYRGFKIEMNQYGYWVATSLIKDDESTQIHDKDLDRLYEEIDDIRESELLTEQIKRELATAPYLRDSAIAGEKSEQGIEDYKRWTMNGTEQGLARSAWLFFIIALILAMIFMSCTKPVPDTCRLITPQYTTCTLPDGSTETHVTGMSTPTDYLLTNSQCEEIRSRYLAQIDTTLGPGAIFYRDGNPMAPADFFYCDCITI